MTTRGIVVVSAVAVIVVDIAVVIVVVVRIVVTVAAVIATVIVSAVPSGIAVIGSTVIDDRGAVPTTVPAAVSPTATAVAHHRAHRDPSSKPDYACGHHRARGICRRHIGIPIHYGGVVFGNVDYLRVGRLNDDGLRRLLHHGDLRTGLKIALGLGLRA